MLQFDLSVSALDTTWKITNNLWARLLLPFVRISFSLYGIPWGRDWRFYGMPIIQKHRQSTMRFGKGLRLRSTAQSNPLGPNHLVILCTWQAVAVLDIGDDFGMAGGSILAARRITLGNRVTVGANCTIVDTDFHPLDPEQRRLHPQGASPSPVSIEDDVFIGINSLILKGVTIGKGSVVGAGSVIARDIPPGMIAAGNPAKVIGQVKQ